MSKPLDTHLSNKTKGPPQWPGMLVMRRAGRAHGCADGHGEGMVIGSIRLGLGVNFDGHMGWHFKIIDTPL